MDPPVLGYLGVPRTKTPLGIPPFPADVRPVTLLEGLTWWMGDGDKMDEVRRLQERLAEKGITHHLIVNAEDEERLRVEFGVRGAHFSHNIFTNESVFLPQPVPKEFEAIYIAGMYPYKRIHLAGEIEQLYVVTYNGRDLGSFCPQVAHAAFNKKFTTPPETAALINRSGVGLCLSEAEGAMYGSMEYLLCGIPVVTTPSEGGREEFFDEVNSILVEPDPGAVRDAVQKLNEHPPDPGAIRDSALHRVIPLRRRYCRYIASVVREAGGKEANPERLYKLYFSESGIDDRAISRNFVPRDLRRFVFDDLDYVPKITPGADVRMHNDGLVLRSQSGLEMGCDQAGSIIWGLCDGTRSVCDIVEEICQAYPVVRSAIESHVRSFLQRLQQHDLVD